MSPAADSRYRSSTSKVAFFPRPSAFYRLHALMRIRRQFARPAAAGLQEQKRNRLKISLLFFPPFLFVAEAAAV